MIFRPGNTGRSFASGQPRYSVVKFGKSSRADKSVVWVSCDIG